MIRRVWTSLVFAGFALPAIAAAQSHQPQLVKPPEFGTVREVTGDDLPVAAPRDRCKASAGDLCADGLPLSDKPLRVLFVNHPVAAGQRLSGPYGQDFRLYDVRRDAKGIDARPVELPTSDIQVPRDCYALNGEDVGYGIIVRNGAAVAVESQMVSCGGGPRDPHGPYMPEGNTIRSEGGRHVTETLRVAGQRRYLAVPGQCDPQYSLRTTWCAVPAVTYMQAHPDEQELDLVAARNPVHAGDILGDKDIDQWVLKRKGDNKFKADGRWFKTSMMTAVDSCWASEPIRWYVEPGEGGLFITEKALNRCGAPLAPVPAATYEAYGDDLFIVDCSDTRDWRNRNEKSPDGCFAPARDYLQRSRQKSAHVVVLNQRARIDDHLYDGGYVSFDVAEVKLNDTGPLGVRRDGYSPYVGLPNCNPADDGPAESHGFVLVRSMGVMWARPYRWMRCPVY
ncbi:hypothetical protein [Asticcacaulis solisilvae]|uniref:hypothetical protein n=1 Tax=Asticcacaulis solisilvae TaxID=1217274 RepID=UPI003FD6E9A9